jgi:hypothetical protein
MSEATVQQLEAEEAAALSEDAQRAAEKRRAAVGLAATLEVRAEAPKGRRGRPDGLTDA